MSILKISPITDNEIAWASEIMGLGPHGFDAVGDDDSRLKAIRNLSTCDFEACPGSGKTTLLVAKLAILASRWNERHRGICVLSHTNAARDEIDQRLSVAGPGAALIRYPHFIGTIHGFVNEYLALPWLRSKGNPIRAIDTSLTLKRRYNRLARKWQLAMEKRNLNFYALQYERTDYSADNKGALSRDTDLCRAMEVAARSVSEEGYFCFDEMFVWANELIDQFPEVTDDLSRRFPLVFIDEAQDNSEIQSALLRRIFNLEAEVPVVRQRFGDSNQAIYGHANADGAKTDRFPMSEPSNLPRSYRFSQEIADVSKGLGVVPQSLVGAGPALGRVRRGALPPKLFLFDDSSIRNVLPKYGEHLSSVFSATELAAGLFTAVAGVHEMDEGKISPIPRAMGNYAPEYNPSIARNEVVLNRFDQYLSRASCDIRKRGNTSSLVNALASALIHLGELVGQDSVIAAQSKKSAHSRLREALTGDAREDAYRELVDKTIALEGAFKEDEWMQAIDLIKAIFPKLGGGNLSSNVAEFLKRSENYLGTDGTEFKLSKMLDNVYSYPPDNPKIRIRLGSIHSVKGETHTATLVLDSYFHKHHLTELKPWILGGRSGGLKKNASGKTELEGPRLLGRLRLHYVAMTRPSHLLCLAMRRDVFSDDELRALERRGWLIEDCKC